MFYGRELRFNPNNHRYYWDDKPVPSVTTIINRLSKPLLIQWAADMAVNHIEGALARGSEDMGFICQEARKAHERIRDEAGDIGSLVHNHARKMLDPSWRSTHGDDQKIAKHPQAVQALRALASWVVQHKIEPIGIERRVMSVKQLYAGTVDFVGRIDGKLGVLDFKTGNGVYDEAWWQTCGYVDALVEEGVLDPDKTYLTRWIVHLSKADGSFTVHERGEADAADYSVWRGLVQTDKALRVARKHPQPKRAKAA